MMVNNACHVSFLLQSIAPSCSARFHECYHKVADSLLSLIHVTSLIVILNCIVMIDVFDHSNEYSPSCCSSYSVI